MVGVPPTPVPNCPDCGRRMKRRKPEHSKRTKGVRFLCDNAGCSVIEVKIHESKNRTIRAARKGL